MSALFDLRAHPSPFVLRLRGGRAAWANWRLWLAGVFLVAGCVLQAVAADALMIAAGAGYKRPVSELAAAFERASGTRVEPFFGNMGQVLTQTAQSGKVALVFGDLAFLEKAEQVKFDSFMLAGKGRLVLAWPKGKQIARVEDIAAAGFTRIALPDVRHAVYGKAASQFLTRSKLADAVKDRLLTVATVPQVSAYLVSGEVDAGFINLTDALGVLDRIGGYIEIDPALYDEIHIVAGVVDGRDGLAGISAFGAFLAAPEARAILSRHGL